MSDLNVLKNTMMVIVTMFSFVLSGCRNQVSSSVVSDDAVMKTEHRIIIDTDTGGDDALAIMMALNAKNITVEGITVLNGNVPLDQAANNALMCVELSGKKDVPVYKGSDTTYDGTVRECYSVFGTDGMGDADLIHPTLTAKETPAVDFILDTVKNNPDQIDIVALGPVTNLAFAFDKDPQIMSKVRSVYVMGTSGLVCSGNATPVAEFNVYSDAVAFERLLESNVKMNVVGLDVCADEDVVFDQTKIEEWKKASDQQKFLATSWAKLFEYYQGNGLDYIDICDAVCMYTVIYDDAIFSQTQCKGICITDEDSAAYGEVIFYRKGISYDSLPKFDSYPTFVVSEINDERYHERLNRLFQN